MNSVKRWKFAKEAFDGMSSDALVQFPREIDEKFKNRQALSYYVNYIAPKVRQFTSYLTQRRVFRDVPNKLLSLILDDADRKGSSLDIFMNSFATNTKLRGTNLCLIDMPKDTTENLYSQIEQRAVPYLVEIAPERVHQYKLDNFGKFEFVIIEDTKDTTEVFGESKNEVIFRYFDKTEWRIYNKDKEVTEKGVHNLGVCPVIYVSESGTFPCVGGFVQIADISKRIMNLRSELDEILRSQTFSVLTYEIPENFNPDKEGQPINLSTDNLLLYKGSRPEFIAPPESPARVYQDEISKLEAVIDKIAFTDVLEGTSESGIAKKYKFQLLNASLTSFAQTMEDFERSVFMIAALWLGVKNDTVINYPKEFNIKDMKEEIEIASAMFDMGISKEYEALKKKELVSLDLSTLETGQLEAINKEIEANIHDRA